MDTLKAIKERRSIRSYQQRPIEAAKIEKLLQAGKYAPHVGSLHIAVIENTDVLKEINDRALESYKSSGDKLLMGRAACEGYRPLYGAPVLFLFSGPNGNPYNSANTSCAAMNLLIAATALELGSCYIVAPLLGIKGNNQLTEKMGIPFGFFPICGVVAGYTAEDAIPSPRPATDPSRIITYCR